MLRFVLLLAAGCVALLVILALLRDRGEPVDRPRPVDAAVVADEPARPQVVAAPEPEAPAAVADVPAEPDDQVAEDAAAVGMTTVEPPAEEPPTKPTG
ncbi:hypothetical protein [Phenylobacterium sp.]|uniref:hypothetical protein n=1 Tax=Phenylobacterium sp. TaxID=1871053 RepID=UPI0039834E44